MANEYTEGLLEQLSEKNAKLISYVANNQIGDKILVRYFPVESYPEMDKHRAFCELFVSAKNYDVNAITHPAVSTIVDPIADGVAYPGTWKLWKTGLNKSTSFPATPTTDAPGVLQQLRTWPVQGIGGVSGWNCRFKTTFLWYWGMTLSEAQAVTIAVQPPQGSDSWVEGPHKEDEGYSVWVYTKVRTEQTVPEYVSGRDSLSTQKSQEDIGSTTGGNLVVPTTPIQGLVYSKNIDKNEDCTYNEKRGIDESIAKIIGPVITSDSVTEQQKATDYLNDRTMPAVPVGIKATVYSGSFRMQKDGTYSGLLESVYSKPVVVGPVIVGQDFVETVYDSIYHANRATVYAPTNVQGTVYNASNRLNADGTYEGGVGSNVSKASVIGPVVTGDSFVDKEITTDYLNSRVDLPAPGSVSGSVYRSGLRVQKDGTYSGNITEEQSKPVVVGPLLARDTFLDSDEETIYQASRSSVVPPDAVQGTLYEAPNRFNKDGTYDATLGQHTSKPVVVGPIITGDSFVEQEVAVDYLNSRSLQSSPANVQGSVYRSSQKMNPDGTYSGPVTQVESKPVVVGPVVTGDSFTDKEITTDYLNSRTIIPAQSGVQGSVYRSGMRIGQDGTFSGPINEEQSKPVVVGPLLSADTFTETEQETIYQASRSPVVPPDATQGTLYQAPNRVNRDGTYDANMGQRTSKEVILYAAVVEDTFLDTNKESVYLNSRSRPVAPDAVQGSVYGVAPRFNADGTYDANQTEKTSKAVSLGPVVTGAKLSVTDNELQNLNARVLADVSQMKGYIYDRVFSFERDGTYHEAVRFQQGNQVDLTIVTASSADETVYLYSQDNHSDIPANASATSPLVVESLSASRNEFDLYNSSRTLSISKLPNNGNEWKWTIRTEDIVWKLPGGAIYIQAQYYETTIGHTTVLATATTNVATVSHGGKIISGSVGYHGKGAWNYSKTERWTV